MVTSGQKVRKLQQTIAKRIRESRIDAGLTQEQLSEKANTSPEYLSRVETGYQFPSLSLIVRLAGALNTTVPTLLTESRDDAQTERINRMAAMLDKLSDKDAEFLESELVGWVSHLEKRSQ